MSIGENTVCVEVNGKYSQFKSIDCVVLYTYMLLWIDETRQNHTVLHELALQQVQHNMDLMINLVDNKNKKR